MSATLPIATRRAAAGILVAAAALLSGCGDSSDGSGDVVAGTTASTPHPSTAHSSGAHPSGTSGAPTGESAPTAVYRPPFVEQVAWTQTEQGSSLQVFPTESGRYTPGESELDAAWSEVVALDRTAESPGMRDQFACHWRFARLVAPEKTSWNLEPWRPVVSESQMIATRCNPGGAEETIP